MSPTQNLLRCFLSVFAIIVWETNPLAAADATFSADGQRVYLIQFDSAKLTQIDLAARASSVLDLGALIGGGEIKAISRVMTGELLCATDANLWTYDVAKGTCAKLCTADEGSRFTDVACNPKKGAVLLAMRKDDEGGAVYLPAGYEMAFSVVMRRVREFHGMAFSSSRAIYFGTRGDLWSGKIELEKNEDSGRFERGVLVATRCAPLATLETANTTPGEIGVEEVAIAGETIYVNLRRMGGSGWGNIVCLNRPPLEGKRILEKRLELYAKEIASVEVLSDTNGTRSYVCASPDGKRVFFSTGNFGSNDTKCFLVENGGKPRELKIVKSK